MMNEKGEKHETKFIENKNDKHIDAHIYFGAGFHKL